MKKNIFAEIKEKIIRRVAENRLRDAISSARSLAETMMAYEASDTLSRAEDTYRQMLRYVESGVEDSHRQAIASELAETVLGVVDSLERRNLKADEPSIYYNVIRYEESQPSATIGALIKEYSAAIADASLFDIVAGKGDSAHRADNLRRREELERRVFNRVWTSFPLTRADAEAVDAIYDSALYPAHFKQLVVWALTLGALHYFDSRRIESLALVYMKSDGKLSVAAATGLLLALDAAKARNLSASAIAKLGALADMPRWASDFRLAYMELVRTRDTDRITTKLQEEVIPQMMKLRPEITKRFSADLPADSTDIEQNPQWQEILDKSGVADKLKEMSEIQEEGGDVMMGTFSQLKSFPFFNDVANWFVPFHPDRSEFSDSAKGVGMFADLLNDMPVLCDSDKYSMMLTMLMAPAQQRQMMINQLNSQQEVVDQLRAASLNTEVTDRKAMFNKVVQNLFRFFRLYRRKGEFPNPFDGAINLSGIKWLGNELADADLLSLIAEFYFSHGYFHEAVENYRQLLEIEQPTAYVYQKLGYAYQKTGDPAVAADYFEKSEMLEPGSPWTLRLLARCYIQLGMYGKAVDALLQLEKLTPDVTNNALLLGHAYMGSDMYDEASKAYFKAEYLGAKPEKVLRNLAWSLLMKRDFKRAREYYEKAIALTGPRDVDYLNLGHLEWAEGNLAAALNAYRRNIEGRARTSSISIAEASELFVADIKADAPDMLEIGIDTALMPMVIDSILYSLE